MAFADRSTYFDCGDSSIVGSFREKDTDNFFEFSENNSDQYNGYCHKIWVTTPSNLDQGFRYGTVKKTVAYIVNGEGVVEKWQIKPWTLKQYGFGKARFPF